MSYDIPGVLTVSVLTPSTSISSNTNTINFDLSPYQGAVGIIANIGANTAGDANAKWQGTVYDSADNSSYAATALVFTNVTNANTLQTLDVDTRTVRRYVRVVQNLYGVNTAYPVSLSVFGQKEYNPNAV